MLAIRFIFLMLLAVPVSAKEQFFGMGHTYLADPGTTITFAQEQDDWRYDVTYFTDYTRRSVLIKEHFNFSVSNRIWKSENWFFDLGVSYSTRQATTTSSPFVFIERFGYKTDNYRIYIRHTSNAGIVPPNSGEDALILEVSL